MVAVCATVEEAQKVRNYCNITFIDYSLLVQLLIYLSNVQIYDFDILILAHN